MLDEPGALTDRIAVVLARPQSADNVAGVVRALRNVGLRTLRLVEPAAWDPVRAEVAAHRSQELVDRVQVFPCLGDALADATYVVGTTARPRPLPVPRLTPREGAPDLWTRAARGLVAVLFGPEDAGLTNADLDRCHAVWSIPTDPAFPSLNLAQAVLLVGYELWMARPSLSPVDGAGRSLSGEPARAEEVERLCALSEDILRRAGFLKPGQEKARLRALRALLHRADPNAREMALLTAMQSRVLRALERGSVEH